MQGRSALAAAALVLAFAAGGAAHADDMDGEENYTATQIAWCNQSHATLRLAFGWFEGETFFSAGWNDLAPGACEAVLAGDGMPADLYWTSDAPDFTGDGHAFCVQDGDEYFNIDGATDCEARGYRTVSARAQPTAPTLGTWVMNLGDGYRTLAVDLPLVDLSGPVAPVRRAAPAPAGGDASTDRRFESPLTGGGAGEGFALDGIFQGCEEDDSGTYCSIHVPYAKLFAYADDPTPRAMLLALEEIEIGTPVSVAGFIVEEGPMYANTDLREVIAHDDDPFRALRDQIGGEWYWPDDPLYGMIVVGSEAHEFYDEDPRGVRFLALAASCPASGPEGPALLVTTVPEGETTCFVIGPGLPQTLNLRVAGESSYVTFARP